MGLGSTAKKVQRLSNLAEKLYAQVNEVLERLSDLTDRVETASEDIETVRHEQREQRAILEAIAAEQGIDVASAIEEADVGGPDEEADVEVGEAVPDSGDHSDEGAAAEDRADEGAAAEDRTDEAEASADAS